MGNQNSEPYAALGARLRFLREQWQQSVAEVSGTLEIEENILSSIEAGKTLPSIEMLDMLISHFLLTDDQAQDLRDLADDQQDGAGDALASGIDDMLMKQVVMYLPLDNKIVYTDSMHATVNDNGVVLQFMQAMPNGQQAPIARVGMSQEHAQKVIDVLQNTLRQHDQGKRSSRLLPDSSSDNQS